MRSTGLILALTAASVISVGSRLSRAAALSNEGATNTPAYELLLVRKAEIEAALKTLSAAYTSQHPKVLRTRDELDAVVWEIDRVTGGSLRGEQLTATYGRLTLRRAALRGELKTLLRHHSAQSPAATRLRNQLDALSEEIDGYLQAAGRRRTDARRHARKRPVK